MKINGTIHRSESTRSRRSISSTSAKASYSTPASSPLPPKSPTINYHCTVELPRKPYPSGSVSPNYSQSGSKSPSINSAQKSPSYPRSPSERSERSLPPSGNRSPSVIFTDANQEDIFDFNPAMQKSPNMTPKSPRSPRFNYSEEGPSSPNLYPTVLEEEDQFFNLQSPPKPKLQNQSKIYHRAAYQASKGESSNSSKSSLEYKSTTKHPNGDYQDIEYKICNSIDSDCPHSSDFESTSSCRYSITTESRRSSSRHSSFKEKNSKKKPPCNIRTNPVYDERYSSNKSIHESVQEEKSLLRCRKSTSDLTDMTDEMAHTTITSLSRPSSPRRKGSIKGGLAYLASRRGSRDSVASNMSNVSNEDIGPLNFQSSARGRQRRTSNFLELPVPDHVRPRVCSLPEKAYNPRLSDDLYRLRTFSITNKGGVVNCGDSIINRRSRSNTSVNSTASRASNVSGERSPFEGSCCGSAYQTVDSSPLGSPEEEPASPMHRVVMLGDSGVGKTALVSQFMTSEYMNTYDVSLDDEFGERTVSILLDGEESEMIFIDHPSSEMSVENSLSTYEPHACVVVYSIVSKSSFHHAEETLNYLWRQGYTKEKSVIVVGNKADLARSRVISTNDGKQLAVSRDCKFIETSSGIQHNVDELLVGILKQIRLRENREKKRQALANAKKNKLHGSKTSVSLTLARDFLNRICINDISKSKSCENLHVL